MDHDSIKLLEDRYRGPGNSVRITTDYGLDGPGSNPGEDENFCPSRSAGVQPASCKSGTVFLSGVEAVGA